MNVYKNRVNRQDDFLKQSGNVLFSTYFVLTVEMSNFTDKRCFKPSILDKTMQLNTTKRTEFFADRNKRVESSFLASKSSPSGFTEVLPCPSNVNSQMNQLFKVPNFDSLAVKKTTLKSLKSPQRRIQDGKVKNDLKLSQQSKMSLIPRPSFINSRKSLHSSRSSQLNARKELIKKMVFLAECALKENNEIKQSTPVKTLAGLTPKKTPRSGGYFVLPEFKKKVQKLEDIRSPIQELIKKEMFAYSAKPTPIAQKITKISPFTSVEADFTNFIVTPEKVKTEVKSLSDKSTRFSAILRNCKEYNAEISLIHEKLKALDDTFENKLKNLPDYRVYNEFCFYQSKKEELYKEIQTLEVNLRNYIASHTNVGSKLKAYIKKKQEFFDEQINLHKNFEQAVSDELEKCKKNEEEKKVEEEKLKPKLRRSLRLSKIKKSRFEERTPMTKKLKKLDSKSKRIQKSGKLRSP